MHKAFSLLLIICLLLSVLPAAAESPPASTPLPGYTLRPSADEVRVYASMSTKANIVGYIIPGGNQSVEVLRITGDWCYVAFSSIYGTGYGYIPLSCFEVAAKPTPTPQPQTTYAPGTAAWIVNLQEGYRLNLREAPSATAVSLGKYYTGTPLILTGQANNGYVHVLLGGLVLGWLDSRFITTDPTAFVPELPIVAIANQGGTILRAGPGTDQNRLSRYPFGTAVTVLGICADGWYHVTVNDRGGYMHESMLSATFPYQYGMESDNPTISDQTTDRNSVFYINTRSNNGVLNLRKSASSKSKSLGKFYTGTPLTILSYTRSGWAYVRIGQTEGYIDVDYLSNTKPTKYGETRVLHNSHASGLNLRSMPSTGGEILAFAPNGSSVIILGQLSDGWYYVDYHGTKGYLYGNYLD